MADNNYHDTLLELIEREIVLAHELGDTLAGENEALRQFDAAKLDRATVTKQHCIEALGALDAERRQLCTALGMMADREGMERLLVQADDADGKLMQRWRDLLTMLETCREANRRNGAMVAAQKRQVTEALGLLRGEAANAPVYDASGDLSATDTSRVHTEI